MGKVLEVIDMLSYDSCHQYVRDMTAHENIFFTTIAIAGIQF